VAALQKRKKEASWKKKEKERRRRRTVSAAGAGAGNLECSFRLYTVRGILPRGLPVERTASPGSVGGVNFYCPLSLAIEKSSG